eukprot:1670-Eustigmatos_ZCMA.PRE.1
MPEKGYDDAEPHLCDYQHAQSNISLRPLSHACGTSARVSRHQLCPKVRASWTKHYEMPGPSAEFVD